MNSAHYQALEGIVTSARISQKPDDLQMYGKDWTKSTPKPSAVIFPKTTEEVSRIMKYCFQNKIKVVPSGGRTGLAGAANASNDELVISLDKMDRILSIDPLLQPLVEGVVLLLAVSLGAVRALRVKNRLELFR